MSTWILEKGWKVISTVIDGRAYGCRMPGARSFPNISPFHQLVISSLIWKASGIFPVFRCLWRARPQVEHYRRKDVNESKWGADLLDSCVVGRGNVTFSCSTCCLILLQGLRSLTYSLIFRVCFWLAVWSTLRHDRQYL